MFYVLVRVVRMRDKSIGYWYNYGVVRLYLWGISGDLEKLVDIGMVGVE